MAYFESEKVLMCTFSEKKGKTVYACKPDNCDNYGSILSMLILPQLLYKLLVIKLPSHVMQRMCNKVKNIFCHKLWMKRLKLHQTNTHLYYHKAGS